MFLGGLSKIKTNHQGTVLILSLVILSILLTMGMIMSGAVVKDIASNRGSNYADSAYYAALTGMNKALWLIDNNIYSNDDAIFFGYKPISYYVDDKINMCPDFLKTQNSDCLCPVTPYNNQCFNDAEKYLIIAGEMDENKAGYDVYMKLEYNNNGGREMKLTAIGKSNQFERILEYKKCLEGKCE